MEQVFGSRPSDELILRIAQQAEMYALVLQVPKREFREVCARVAKAVETLREALAESEDYNETLLMALGPDGKEALANVQRFATGLANGRRGRRRNTQLRLLIDVVLDAYWSTGALGKLGINTKRGHNTRYGPTLDIVKEALRLVGIREENLPPDDTIQKAAREVMRAKIVK